MTKIKTAIEIIKNRLDQAEEIICEIEKRTFEIILSEDRKEKRKIISPKETIQYPLTNYDSYI